MKQCWVRLLAEFRAYDSGCVASRCTYRCIDIYSKLNMQDIDMLDEVFSAGFSTEGVGARD